MVRELSEVLADSVDARARSVAGLTPHADDFATVVKTVRRRRVVRHTLQTLAAVPIVGGLAAGAYLGLGALQSPDPVGPATTPDSVTSAPTAAPTAEPTVVPSPATELDKGALVSTPGLPPYFEAPSDLASHLGPGWVALTYRSVAASNEGGIDEEPTEHALFLAAPDGSLFRTADLQPELEIRVVHWDAAGTRARVSWPATTDRLLTVGWLDVVTGNLTEDAEQFDNWATFIGHADDGAELWVEDAAYYDGGSPLEPTVWAITPDGSRRTVAELGEAPVARIDPAGTQLLTAGLRPVLGFGIVHIASGQSREVPFGLDGRDCAVVGWLDSEGIAVLCHDPVSDEAAAALDRVDFVAQDAALYRFPAAGGAATVIHTFADGEPVPEMWSGLTAADGRLAYVVSSGFPEGCSQGVAVWDGESPRTVLDSGDHGANMFVLASGAPGSVLIASSQSCESAGAQSEVTMLDAATGQAHVLTPWLDTFPEDGIDYWHSSVSSAAAGVPARG